MGFFFFSFFSFWLFLLTKPEGIWILVQNYQNPVRESQAFQHLEARNLSTVSTPPPSSWGALDKQNYFLFLFSGKGFAPFSFIWEYELWGLSFAALFIYFF